METFRINQYLTLKLDNGKTNIYINGELFQQCKYLLLEILKESIGEIDNINPIDAAAEKLEYELEEHLDIEIEPNEEFWAHCSNLQVWVENDYDSRLLHSNLAFPLLKKLSEIGDLKALKVFKEEIIYRFFYGTERVQRYLIEEGYLDLITDEEKYSLIESEKDIEALKKIENEIGAKLQVIPTLKGIDTEYSNFLKSFVIDNGKIVALRLCKCNINKIPEAVKNFQNLETLIICADDTIKEIPSWIGDLSNLKEIILRGLEIITLPETFGNLIYIEKLNLSLNSLETLPDSFGNLINLKDINLTDNSLKLLPESFGNLINLKKLELDYENLLTTLPESFGNLKSLERLTIRRNKLSSLPESFGNLKSLKALTLNNNKLESLPDSMGHLKSLKVINLNDNEFVDFPKCLIKCESLKRIYLSDNKIKEIPQSIIMNNTLEILGLRNNEIKNFPQFLLNMKSIKKLDLKHNPIRNGYIVNPKIEVILPNHFTKAGGKRKKTK